MDNILEFPDHPKFLGYFDAYGSGYWFKGNYNLITEATEAAAGSMVENAFLLHCKKIGNGIKRAPKSNASYDCIDERTEAKIEIRSIGFNSNEAQLNYTSGGKQKDAWQDKAEMLAKTEGGYLFFYPYVKDGNWPMIWFPAKWLLRYRGTYGKKQSLYTLCECAGMDYEKIITQTHPY